MAINAERSSRGLRVLVWVTLAASSAAWGDVYSFTADPADVAGPAGSTVGWGYTISNESATAWLVLTSLNAGTFDHGSPDSLFDFPTLAPDTSVSVSFDPTSLAGLYELTWDATAPAGFVNSGFFDLTAQWWDGDPLSGGSFLGDAPEESAAYSATVLGVTGVPEPLMPWPVGLIAAVMFIQKARRRTDSSF
jgi:hypothetical protein